MNGVKVSKEVFSGMDHSAQNTILFENTEKILETLASQALLCDSKHAKIERRKKIDTSLGVASGFIGGFMAMIGKWIIIK